MKKFCLGLLMIGSFICTQAFALTSVPAEVSALLQETAYQTALNQRKEVAVQSGRTLHITSFDVVDIESAKFVYVMLATSFSADVTHELTSAGSIVASVVFGPQGEIQFDGIYYKPADEGPGGSSVGN